MRFVDEFRDGDLGAAVARRDPRVRRGGSALQADGGVRRPHPLHLQVRFGPQSAWGSTLRTLLWTRVTLVVPPFTDLDVAASRYLDSLDGGDVPLELLFSGTVFYSAAGGMLQAARIPWEQGAEYRLPVRVWREALDRHFPDSAWLRVRKATFDRLATHKAANALPTWDAALEALFPDADEEAGWTR